MQEENEDCKLEWEEIKHKLLIHQMDSWQKNLKVRGFPEKMENNTNLQSFVSE